MHGTDMNLHTLEIESHVFNSNYCNLAVSKHLLQFTESKSDKRCVQGNNLKFEKPFFYKPLL